MHSPAPYDAEWPFALQQPVVSAVGTARNWVEVLWELAHRAGFADDFYVALNNTLQLKPEYRLEKGKRYTFEEFCDRWTRDWCGEEHGLEYFKEHGWATAPLKREVIHRYPRIFHKGRVPLYLEHWLTAGESVKEVVEESQIDWGDISDYEPLVNYRPCKSSIEGGDDFPLYLTGPKVGFLTLNTSTIKNPHLQELAWATGEVFNASIHPTLAKDRGISNGDSIEIEEASGKKTVVQARISSNVHPKVISASGNVAKVLSPNETKVMGLGVHINSFLSYDLKRIDMVSGALDACVKVRIRKVKK